MKIAQSIVLVSGTNRGIGRAFVKALADRGARKIYAGARDPGKSADLAAAYRGLVEVVPLDVTSDQSVSAAAARCADINLLLNNAGFNANAPALRAPSFENARREIETNYFGLWRMCKTFAPVLAAQGGGALINMLSLLARINLPMMATYCCSKAAAFSLTQSVRAELAGQKTHVLAVMPGAVDTDATAHLPPPKMEPIFVVNAALDALERGEEEIYPGDMAAGVLAGLAADPKGLEKQFAGYL